MWKKIQCALFACILCMAVTAVGAAQESDVVQAAEKPERIELVLVLDKSGSMAGLESDTIGGFNAMVEKQKELALPVRVTTVLFNDERRAGISSTSVRTSTRWRKPMRSVWIERKPSPIGTRNPVCVRTMMRSPPMLRRRQKEVRQAVNGRSA